MHINDIINNVIAGGFLGMVGQGIRIAVGLKKLNESNKPGGMPDNIKEDFDSSRLFMSIFIGFIAGAIGMLVKSGSAKANEEYDTEAIIAIIAIGYSGADFIEGVFNTYSSKFTSLPVSPPILPIPPVPPVLPIAPVALVPPVAPIPQPVPDPPALPQQLENQGL